MKQNNPTSEYTEPKGFAGTKKQWEVEDRGSGSLQVCVNPYEPRKKETVCQLSGYGNNPEVKANAALIAQAKELAKALQAIVEKLDISGNMSAAAKEYYGEVVESAKQTLIKAGLNQ